MNSPEFESLHLAFLALASAIDTLRSIDLLFFETPDFQDRIMQTAAELEALVVELNTIADEAIVDHNKTVSDLQAKDAALEAHVADLEAQVAAGTATQATIDGLASLKAKLLGLKTVAPITPPPTEDPNGSSSNPPA